MSYVFVNIFPPMFYSSLTFDVFVVLLVIKILMFLLVTGPSAPGIRGHKTRKDKYYVKQVKTSWKSLRVRTITIHAVRLCPAVT